MANDRLYVGFVGDRVDVYDLSVQPNPALLHSISGSNTHLGGITSLTVDATGNIYVANAANSEITVFDPNAEGNIAPSRIITGQVGVPQGVAFDSVGYLYVLNTGGFPANRNVTVYAPGASGSDAPVRTVSGIQVGDGNLTGMAVDMRDQLYVCGDIPGNIKIYPAYANGATAAVDSRSGLQVPVAMDFDGNNDLFVSDVSLGQLVFDPGGASRGTIGANGILAVDQFGLVYTAADEEDVILNRGNPGVVLIFAPGGSGYGLIRSFPLAVAKAVSAMAVNKPRPPIPARVPNRLVELVATLMTAGVPVDGGGVVFVGNIPIPIPIGPWGEASGTVMSARRDLLVGLALEQLASEVRDKAGQNAIRRAALELVKAKGEELLSSL